MAITNVKLTTLGIALQAKVEMGDRLELTRIVVGTGVHDETDYSDVTDVLEPVLDLPIQKIENVDSMVRVSTSFDNRDVEKGFFYREVGLYAKDLDYDEGEILFIYGNAGEHPDFVPSVSSQIIEKEININIVIGNAENVTANIDENMRFITQKEFEEHKEEIKKEFGKIAGICIPTKVDITLFEQQWQEDSDFYIYEINHKQIKGGEEENEIRLLLNGIAPAQVQAIKGLTFIGAEQSEGKILLYSLTKPHTDINVRLLIYGAQNVDISGDDMSLQQQIEAIKEDLANNYLSGSQIADVVERYDNIKSQV